MALEDNIRGDGAHGRNPESEQLGVVTELKIGPTLKIVWRERAKKNRLVRIDPVELRPSAAALSSPPQAIPQFVERKGAGRNDLLRSNALGEIGIRQKRAFGGDGIGISAVNCPWQF